MAMLLPQKTTRLIPQRTRRKRPLNSTLISPSDTIFDALQVPLEVESVTLALKTSSGAVCRRWTYPRARPVPRQSSKGSSRRELKTFVVVYSDSLDSTRVVRVFQLEPIREEGGWLGGLGKAAIKLFAEIARSQASSRHPVGHILRRLIDISQIAVQRGNFRRLQHAVSLCSLDDPFSNLPISREHLRAMDAVARSEWININKKK